MLAQAALAVVGAQTRSRANALARRCYAQDPSARACVRVSACFFALPPPPQQMASVWTEVCNHTLIDSFEESRGKVSEGMLRKLADQHALVYRNHYCLVFVEQLEARLVRHSAITRTQVALHVVSLITHRNQGHATSVMTHALQQLRDRAEYDMQAVGVEVREKVTIASSQIVAQGKMNGYVVRLLRRCCSNVGGLQVRFDPEGRRKAKDYFFISLSTAARAPAKAQVTPRPRSTTSSTSSASSSPCRVRTRRMSPPSPQVESSAAATASTRRSGCVATLSEYIELQAHRRNFWKDRVGAPCCCCFWACDEMRLLHTHGAVTFELDNIRCEADANLSADEIRAVLVQKRQDARELLLRGGFRAIVGNFATTQKDREEVLNHVLNKLSRPVRTPAHRVAFAAGHYYFTTDVVSTAAGTLLLAPHTTHRSGPFCR